MTSTVTATSIRPAIVALIAGWAIAVTAFVILLIVQGPTPGLVVALSSGFAAVSAATVAGVVAVQRKRAGR